MLSTHTSNGRMQRKYRNVMNMFLGNDAFYINVTYITYPTQLNTYLISKEVPAPVLSIPIKRDRLRLAPPPHPD